MRRRLVVMGILVAGVLATVLPTPAHASTCRVIDAQTGEHSWGAGPNLERALESAEAGDHLEISGICRGNFVMREELRLTGVATPRFPQPTLDAGGHRRVVLIRDGGVLRSIRIRNGRAAYGGGLKLLSGRLELRGTTEVVGNRAGSGGGIHVEAGDLVMLDRSSVHGNRSTGGGGGASVEYAGHLIMRDRSAVRGNVAGSAGGGVVVNIGIITMTGFSSVTGNESSSDGGGIANLDGWTWFRNRASVTGNTAGPEQWGDGEPGAEGGGVYVFFGSGGVCSRWVRLSPNTPNDALDWQLGC